MRLRLPLTSLLLLALVALAPSPARAQSASYTAIVPVPDTSEAQRDHAFTVGLTQVLGRVAGRDLSSQPGYADALAKAPSLVQQYQYQRGDKRGSFLLQITFDRAAVRHMIDGLGATTWAGSRPPVLLLVRDAAGNLLEPAQLVALTQAAGARGVTFVFAHASGAPDPAQLQAADEDALASVARRFHTGLVLIGQQGAGQDDWTLVAAGRVSQWQSRGADQDSMLGDAGNALVDHLTAQFGSAPSGVAGTGTLWVGGLGSADDFAQLLAMLRQNNLVKTVTPEQAEGNGTLLRIEAGVPVSAVTDELLAEGRLLPAAQPHAGADASARWVH